MALFRKICTILSMDFFNVVSMDMCGKCILFGMKRRVSVMISRPVIDMKHQKHR